MPLASIAVIAPVTLLTAVTVTVTSLAVDTPPKDVPGIVSVLPLAYPVPASLSVTVYFTPTFVISKVALSSPTLELCDTPV